MVLVPSFFCCSPLGFVTKRHVAKGAHKDHEDEEYEYERLHNALLCCCMPDPVLATWRIYSRIREETSMRKSFLSPIWCEDGNGNELLTPFVSRFLGTDMLSSTLYIFR